MSNKYRCKVQPVLWVVLVLMLVLTGCRKKDPVEQTFVLQMIPYTSALVAVDQQSAPGRHNLPADFLPYHTLYPQTSKDNATIGVFMTMKDKKGQSSYTPGTFVYQGADYGEDNGKGNMWRSTIKVLNEQQYYIYGFMPQEASASSTIAPLKVKVENDSVASYEYGAVMKINQLNAVTAADVCVLVGVKQGTSASIHIDDENLDVRQGEFGYVGKDNGNYVYLLLDHLYSSLHFNFSLDEEYAKIRQIKIDSVVIETQDAKTFDVNVKVVANSNNANPIESITYSKSTGEVTEKATAVLFDAESEDDRRNLKTAFNVNGYFGCFAPKDCNDFYLVTRYGVYDRFGNWIEDRVARNHIVLVQGQIQAGRIFTFRLKVKPTYLYTLTDPDAENPTIVLE